VVMMPRTGGAGRTGLLPFPVTFDPAHGDVSDPDATVSVLDTKSQLFNWPNVIREKDFTGWTGNRARGVPAMIDQRYHALLATGDEGQRPATGALIMARVGKGTVVYSALSIDTQLAAANPGAARLLVNLLSAGLSPGK
jgi:hypothetical protein